MVAPGRFPPPITQLRLYCTPYCFFCTKVRIAADEWGVDLEEINIMTDVAGRDFLIRQTGRSRVPVLAIVCRDGEALLPESQDIIDFLRQNYGPNSS